MLVEFTLCAIPLVFLVMSLFWAGIGVWEYHTLAEAVNETARYASVHGSDCAGQTCSTTVAQVANVLAGRASGIPAGQLNATLTSTAQSYTCNPLTNCQSNVNPWPSLSGNTPVAAGSGTDISIRATFQFTAPINMWVPGHGAIQFAGVTFAANSTQPVIY
jgi:hypothetical protein